MKLVSYVLATRNHATKLPRIFENIREFYDETSELIVVEGASTDNTLDIIDRNRDIISVLISEPDRSEAHAYNKGFLAATGEVIKYLTDDDYYYPQAMRKAVRCLADHEDLDVLVCGGRSFSTDGKMLSALYCPDGVGYFSVGLPKLADIGICSASFLFRRRLLSYLGLLDTSYFTPDAEFICRMRRRGISGKFYRVHLYDHTLWPGSGAWREPVLCRRDWRRLLVAEGEWSAAFVQWMKEVGWGTREGSVKRAVYDLFKRAWRARERSNAGASLANKLIWDEQLL